MWTIRPGILRDLLVRTLLLIVVELTYAANVTVVTALLETRGRYEFEL